MNKKGFTLIEVGLFLAISGLLVAAIVAGSFSSIARNRYMDSVENFADYLKGVYSSINNPSFSGTIYNNDGRSNQSVYGKLLVFGSNYSDKDHPTRVYSYDVIGKTMNSATSSKYLTARPIDLIRDSDITASNIFIFKDDDFYAQSVDYYDAQWGAEIEDEEKEYQSSALLIVRSPASGRIFTYFAHIDWATYNSPKYVLEEYESINAKNYLATLLNAETGFGFSETDVDFCIDSEDVVYAGNRRANVRIRMGASNASAVEIIREDSENNRCEI